MAGLTANKFFSFSANHENATTDGFTAAERVQKALRGNVNLLKNLEKSNSTEANKSALNTVIVCARTVDAVISEPSITPKI